MFTDADTKDQCNLLVKQFSEKEVLLKLLLSKYLELKRLEKGSIREVFKRKLDDLMAHQDDMNEDQYQATLEDLKIREENMLKETDHMLSQHHVEEQAIMKKILERRHAQEHSDMKEKILDMRHKAYIELFGALKDREVENEKRALEKFKEQ